MMNNRVYFAKNGKLEGPFSNAQVEKMRKSGMIHLYNWMWKDDQNEWQPVDPAPSVSPPKFRRNSVESLLMEREVFCFAQEQILCGRLLSADPQGALFEVPMSEVPLSTPQDQDVGVILQMELEKGSSTRVRAVLRTSTFDARNTDSRRYQLRWVDPLPI
jgi:hypothetical protein